MYSSKNLKQLSTKNEKKTITQTTGPVNLHKDALLQGMCQKGAIDQHMVRLLPWTQRWANTKLTELEKTNHGKEYPPGN